MSCPTIVYPEALPVSQRRIEIQQLLKQHQVLIVCGETGSGKTTQLPKMCLEMGRGQNGQSIVHTQPRRLAATATAKRIASELNTELGLWVGFKIRFSEKTGANTAIKLVTDGILLAESQTDALFKKYDTIIIDEAHERSLNIDFLLGYLKKVLPQRPDLKVIVTSATIDSKRFSEHFCASNGSPAPIVEVSGRLFPVEVRYKDPNEFDPKSRKTTVHPKAGANEEVDEDAFYAAALDAVQELWREGSGDILMFMPGEREIREANHFFRTQFPTHIEILPLFARLNAADQEKIFQKSNTRRIVLATNVAETSLTVPGIRYVIDSGRVRVKRYSYRNKVEMLQIEQVSKASANQRAGRCGRVSNGICIRLYSEHDFEKSADFTDPEILRSSLASVILKMKTLGLSDIEEFDFLQKPHGRAIADGYQLLHELNALDELGKLTKIGHSLGRLPLDPKIARMLFEASKLGCLAEMLVIASALSIQDPRERPHDTTQAADQAQLQFKNADSDFESILQVWRFAHDLKKQNKSKKSLHQAYGQTFLSPRRMHEWQEVHQQLSTLILEKKWEINVQAAKSEQVHRALLSGLLGHIGLKNESEPFYQGARGIRFVIHPSSGLFKKGSKWVVAAELVETTRLYARHVSKIDSSWLEQMGSHLIKRSHTNPHWEKNSGQAMALETGTIYGLPIYSKRKVSVSKFDRALSRKLMIQEGLCTGQIQTNLNFYLHNQKIIKEIEKMEHQTRRQDLLIDDALIVEFYDQNLPTEVFNQNTLEAWAQTAEEKSLNALYLSKDELLNKRAGEISTDFYPKIIHVSGISLKLNYHFEPGSPRDGVTVVLPLLFLNQVNSVRFEWLVPGILKEKVSFLLKSLPQKLRRHCVPIPELSEKFMGAHSDMSFWDKPLVETLRSFVIAQTGARPNLTDFRPESLPTHHFMNYKLVDEHGRQLDMQRSLSTLRAQWSDLAHQTFQSVAQVRSVHNNADLIHQKTQANKASPQAAIQNTTSETIESCLSEHEGQAITSWTFGVLPELLTLVRDKQNFFGYPALKDKGEYCVIEVFDQQELARQAHAEGVLRLYSIALKDSLKFLGKNLPDFQKLAMLYISFGTPNELQAQWTKLALMRACLLDQLPTSQAEFEQKSQAARARINLIGQEIGKLLFQILNEHNLVLNKLKSIHKLFPDVGNDIQNQLAWLLPKNFLIEKSWEKLSQYARYLKAISIRIDRLKNDSARDELNMREISKLQSSWSRVVTQLKGHREENLEQFGWQLQELRVSLFAQELRTPMPVSIKRLQKTWDLIAQKR